MAISWNKPARSLNDTVRLRSERLFSILEKSPRLATGAGVAALIAPLFLKNDERGYLQTSVMTTPLITAGAMVAPKLFDTTGREARRIIAFAKTAPKRVQLAGKARFDEIVRLHKDYERKVLPLHQYEGMLIDYYADGKKQVDFAREASALEGIFQKLAFDPTRQAMISNAIHAERLRTLSAADLAQSPMSPVAGLLDPSDMAAEILAQIEDKNEGFVRGMNARLRELSNIQDQGGSATSVVSAARRYKSLEWTESSYARARLEEQRPDLFREVERAIAARKIDPEGLQLVTLESNKAIHPIVGLRLNNDLIIPVVDSNGAVQLGEQFDNRGVSRLFYTSNEIMKSDVYAVRNLEFGSRRIREELSRANIYGAIDTHEDFSTFVNPAFGEYAVSDVSVALRSRQAIPSQLTGFFGEGMNALSPEQREAAFLGAMKTHRGTNIASESGVAKQIMELGETEALALFGRPNVEKQNARWRSFTKPVSLTAVPDVAPESWMTIRDSLRPFSTTDYLEKIAPGASTREFALRVAGISPQQKALFGGLPENANELSGAATEQRAIAAMMKDANLDEHQARQAWMELSKYLSDPKNLQAMRKTGYLGEGGYLMPTGLHHLKVETTKNYYVHELRLDNWKDQIGKPLTKDTLLGFNFGNPVLPEGKQNFIENVTEMGDGRFAIQVRETFDLGTGAKLDALVKGLVHGVSEDEYERLRQGMNIYHQAAGTGGFVPREAKAMALFHYAHDKADPVESFVNMASDTVRRLEENGESAVVDPYLDALQQVGLDYDAGTLKFKTTAMEANVSARDEMIEKARLIVTDMMQEVGDRLRSHTIRGDEFMQAYASLTNDISYGAFVTRNALPTNARVWNHTALNVPREAGVTYDILQQLSMRGYHGAATDIYHRLNFDGDPMMTRNVERHLNGEKGAITETLSIRKALGGKNLGKLSTAAGRAGTIFDPGNAAAKQNFLLQLPDGSALPVLGHDAYGGKVNRYGLGEFSQNSRESRLADVIRMFEEAPLDQLPGAGDLAKAKQSYLDELRKLTFGKHSYLRADAADPLGTGKFIQTRESTLRFANGEVNPFEVGIGEDIVKGIGDEGIRQAIMKGEEVYAAVARHPVSHVPFVRVKYDPNLNSTNIIGMDEGFRGLMMADDDGDMIFSYFFQQGSDGWKQAQAAVMQPDSLQHFETGVQQGLEGVEDVSRLVTNRAPKDIFERAATRMGDLMTAISRRGASGSIGSFSNTLTKMMIGLEHHEIVTEARQKATLQRLFWSIRQAPIAAAKMKNPEGLTFSSALALNNQLSKSLDGANRFEEFYQSMLEITKHSGPDLHSFVKTERALLLDFHRGIRPEVRSAAAQLVSSPETAVKTRGASGIIGDMLPYIQGASREARSTSMGARMAAEAIGATNRTIRIARELKHAASHRGAGRVLGVGAAVAAVAGVFTGSLSTPRASAPVFTRDSANAQRPEVAAGVMDHVPGQAVAGMMAPSNPPRSIRRGPTGVKTAVVAPIRQASDLEVNMRSDDPSRVAETARMLARMSSDGDTNVTVNYRNNPKINSLRARQKIRETLDQS